MTPHPQGPAHPVDPLFDELAERIAAAERPPLVWLPSRRHVRELEQRLLARRRAFAGLELHATAGLLQRLAGSAIPQRPWRRTALLAWLGARRPQDSPAARRELLQALQVLRRLGFTRARELPRKIQDLPPARLLDDFHALFQRPGRMDGAALLERARAAGAPPEVLALAPGPAAPPEAMLLGAHFARAGKLTVLRPQATGPLPAGRVECFSAQGEAQEFGEALARARRMIAEEGLAPHRVALLPASWEPYAALLPGAAERERLPFWTPRGRSRALTRAAARSLAAARLLGGARDRTTLLACFAALDGAERPSDSDLAELDRRLRADPRGDPWTDEFLASRLEDPRLRALIPELPDLEAELRALGLPAPSREELPETLEEWIGEESLRFPGVHEEGVFVAPPHRAWGLPFDAVFLLGLERGAVEREETANRFLPDEALAELGRALEKAGCTPPEGFEDTPPLPRGPAARRGARRALFDALARQAPELVLSYAHADQSGKPRGESLWLRGLRRALEASGHSAAVEALPAAPGARFLRRATRHGDLPPEHARFLRAFQEGPQDPELVLRESFPRPQDAPNPFDALALHDPPRRPQLSVTDFASLGTCPLQTFFTSVLQLEPLPDETDVERPPPLAAGRALHEILHAVFRGLRAEGLFAPGVDPAARRARARALLGEAFARHEDAFVPPLAKDRPALAADLRARRRAALERVLFADLAELDESGFVPLLFEHEITGEVALRARCGGSVRVALRGRIDRVDVRFAPGTPPPPEPEEALAAASELRLIDYKSSGTGADLRPGDLLKGAQLQLPLYGLLLERLSGQAGKPISFELRPLASERIERDGLPRRRFPDACFAKPIYRESFEDTLAVLGALQARGHFPFKKGTACDYCGFRAACPRFHEPSIRRLEARPELRAWHRLEKKSTNNYFPGAEEDR